MPILTHPSPIVPPELSKGLEARYPVLSPPQQLTIKEVATVWFAKERALADWRNFNVAYSVPDWRRRTSKPRWGQPGHHRRRKMRMEARRKNEMMWLVRRACEKLDWDMKRQAAVATMERDRKVFEELARAAKESTA